MIEKLEELIIDEPKIAEKESGYIGSIYVFINKENNKIYVGKTTQSYLARWVEHKCHYQKDYSGNSKLYAAIRKYGWYGFERFVIYQTPLIDNIDDCNILLSDKEIYYISYFDSMNNGYNLTIGGDGDAGKKMTPEQIKAMSERMRGENHWNYGNRNGKGSHAVLQFDLDFNFIKEWPSYAEVARELGLRSNNISRCCANKLDTYGGFIWVDKNKYYDGYLETYKFRAKCKSNDRRVLQYDFNGNFVAEFISASEASRSFGKNSTVASAANGNSKQCYGYLWIYKDSFSEELLQQKIKDAKTTKTYKKFINDKLSNKS